MIDNEPHIDIYTINNQVYTVPLKEIRLNRENDMNIDRECCYSRYFFVDFGIPDNLRTWRAISKEEYDRIRDHLNIRRGLIDLSSVKKTT